MANHRERPASRDTALRIGCRTPSMYSYKLIGIPRFGGSESPFLRAASWWRMVSWTRPPAAAAMRW